VITRFYFGRIEEMKIAIVAGGTGGHIYPAIALADGLISRGHEVLFIGSNNRMEADVIPSKGYKFIGLDVLTPSGNVIDKAKCFLSLDRAYRKAQELLKGYDLAIGFGNYISYPIMNAAIKLGLKTAIHEQNSFAGKANLMLDEKVDVVFGSYEENLQSFKNKNTFIYGNPQASIATNVKKNSKVIEDLGLDPNKKTLTIFMGSLGSATVNETLIEYFKMLDGKYQVIYATGSSHYDKLREQIKDTSYLKVFERIDGINVMKNSTLLLCRAGATTLTEICAIGMPSVVIPSPFVPNNHQYYNGMALYKNKACEMIEEKDLNAKMLYECIDSIINDEDKLNMLHENALKMANPDVLNNIIDKMESIC